MDVTKNISELEETVARDRSRYVASGEKDWHRLAMALRALSERYSCEGLYVKAGECDAEYNSILAKVQRRVTTPLPVSKGDGAILYHYDETDRWAERVEECRKAMEEGGPPNTYAKAVYAYCEHLRLAGLTEMALRVSEEALQALLPKTDGDDADGEYTYGLLVNFLSAAGCAEDLRNESLSRNYGVYPLLCFAERAGKEEWGPSGINWGFIAELCRTLIKQ